MRRARPRGYKTNARTDTHTRRAAPPRGGDGRSEGRRGDARGGLRPAPPPAPGRPGAASRAAGSERGGGGGARGGREGGREEKREGGASGPNRDERNAQATGGRRQDAPARWPLRHRPPTRSPAARARPGGAGAAAGAGGGSSELEPRAPECRVSASALARGRPGRGPPAGGLWAGRGCPWSVGHGVCPMAKGSAKAVHPSPQLGDLRGNFPGVRPFF